MRGVETLDGNGQKDRPTHDRWSVVGVKQVRQTAVQACRVGDGRVDFRTDVGVGVGGKQLALGKRPRVTVNNNDDDDDKKTGT